ncbi:MAG: glycosyltransferase [Candidatus ainarchaeum sp.]|nr:glycosyltransferase [Candidatus ainarchaeum sp.]
MTLTDFIAKIIEYPLRGFGKFLWSFAPRKATIIIPAFNEAKTIRKVAKTALGSYFVSEVIVVDDGSTDKTIESLKRLNVKIIRHEKNLGKGKAVKTGIENSSNEIILFLDADLQNIDTEKIRKLIMPILENKAEFTKSTFSRARGRVTEFAVKPMIKILYPKLEFSQPISGQFAGKKSFLSGLTIEDRYGIDIAILLDAVKAGQKIVEVDIGTIVHRGHSNEEVAEMSKQVLETMLKKSGLTMQFFKAIVFSENALFSNSKLRKNALEVISRLKKRKAKIIMLGYSNNAKEKAKQIGCHSFLNANVPEHKLLSRVKKTLKKNGFSLEDTAIVGTIPKEEILLKAGALGIAFGKSGLEKIADKTIQDLSELLLIEEKSE